VVPLNARSQSAHETVGISITPATPAVTAALSAAGSPTAADAGLMLRRHTTGQQTSGQQQSAGPHSHVPAHQPLANERFVRAKFPYSAGGNKDALTFKAGDVMRVVREIKPEWWIGELNGRQGLFPVPYVEQLSPAQVAALFAPAHTPAAGSFMLPPSHPGGVQPHLATPGYPAGAVGTGSQYGGGAPPAVPAGQWGPYMAGYPFGTVHMVPGMVPGAVPGIMPAHSFYQPVVVGTMTGQQLSAPGAKPARKSKTKKHRRHGSRLTGLDSSDGHSSNDESSPLPSPKLKHSEQLTGSNGSNGSNGSSGSLPEVNLPAAAVAAAGTASSQSAAAAGADDDDDEATLSKMTTYRAAYPGKAPSVPPLGKGSGKEKKAQKTAFKAMVERILKDDPTLERCKMAGCQLNSRSVKTLAEALRGNTHLRTLDLSKGVRNESDIAHLVTALLVNPHLRELDLTNNSLSMSTARKLEDLACRQAGLHRLDLYSRDRLSGSTSKDLVQVAESVDRYCMHNRVNDQYTSGSGGRLMLVDRKLARLHPSHLLAHLVHLNVSHNQLNWLPRELASLKQLRHLNISNNLFEHVPPFVGEVRTIDVLLAADNEISDLPESLSYLPLTRLDISGNKFSRLPSFLPHIPTLKNFSCVRNKLKGLPREVVARGDASALAYLRALASGTKQCHRMKLMFVGAGNVGKSTLLEALVAVSKKRGAKTFARSQAEPNVATDGIDITDIQLRLGDAENDERLELSCWDFAGQEVYYSTHSFFLSHRAIYLVVVNVAKGDISRIDYWLNSIKARAPEAPVLLVGTHLDDPVCTDQYLSAFWRRVFLKYRKRFPQVVGRATVSSRTLFCVSELLNMLRTVALAQSYVPEEVPKSYLAVEQKVRDLAALRPTGSLSEFSHVARDCGVAPGDVEACLQFLSDSGAVTWFPLVDRELVVYDNQWITNMFATIITLKTNFVVNGVLSRSACSQLWKPPTYPLELHPFLINLLRRFELAYPLPAGFSSPNGASPQPGASSAAAATATATADTEPELLLIPCLLHNDVEPERLASLWPRELAAGISQLRRYFTFDFLPNGFFPRLLVRLLTATSWLPEHFWKNGVLVRMEDARMLLQFDPHSNCLQLAVRGAVPGKHIAAMVESLDTLCQDWLREPYESFVPCAHCLAEGEEAEPFLFSLRDLERAAATDQAAVFCRGTTPVSVSELVPDIAMHSFEDCTVEFDEIEMGEELGVGGYAVVLLGKFQGQSVAVKKLQLPEAVTEEQMEQIVSVFQEFRREAQLMSTMHHPNVVGLLGVVRDPLCLVLELMDLGSLHDVLHDESRILDWRTKLSFADDVAKGMAYLHRFKLIHRDLKSPNVLVKKDEAVDVGVSAKIADFGLTRKMELTDALKTKAVDNPVWLAPEILTKQKYTEMVDVYSFGVILWEIATRKEFFGDVSFMSVLEDKIISGERPPLPEDVPDPAVNTLIENCWATLPTKRPTFESVVTFLEAIERPPVDPAARASFGHAIAKENRGEKLRARGQLLQDTTDAHSATNVTLRAKWAFAGKGEDELSFEKGDYIELLETDEQRAWARGRLASGATGWFQLNYAAPLRSRSEYDDVTPSAAAQATGGSDGQSGPKPVIVAKNSASVSAVSLLMDDEKQCVRTIQSFTAPRQDLLSYMAGDVIELESKINETWWLGTLNGKRGLFLARHVRPISIASVAETLALVQEKERSGSSEGESITDDAGVATAEGSSSFSVEFVRAMWDFAGEQEDELSFKKGDLITVLEYDGEWMRGKLGDHEGWFQGDYVQSVGSPQMELTSVTSLAKFSTLSNNSCNSDSEM